MIVRRDESATVAQAARALLGFIALALILTSGAAALRAQAPAAALGGTAWDENGAVVAGVDVTVVSEETGARRATTTGDDGYFLVAPLPPGRYTVTARRQGFATTEVKGLVLNVNDRRSLRIQLKVGEINESVAVEGASLVQAESSSVSTLVDRQFVENLPLNGRSFDALLELTPGTAVTVVQSFEPGRFSVNGQRPNANYFTIDGVGANVGISPGTFLEQTAAGTTPPVSALGSTNTLVPVDDIQEFRVNTSTYAPEFGRTPGAQVSIVTRSGTNEFHGTLFEYFRNEALDANDWFANRQGLNKPAMRQNDFGGVLGGPVLRNRTFFFASYEGLRLRLPRVALSQVPSLGLRQSAPPSAQPLLNSFPLPNGRDFGNGLAEFSASFSNPATVDATSVRIDQIVGSRLLLFGRFNHAPSDFSARGGLGGLSLSVPVRGSFGTTTLTLGATQVLTPRVSNDLRFNYSRARAGTSYPLDDFGGAVPPAASFLFPPSVNPENAQFTFSFLNATAWTFGQLAENFQRQLNVVDNVTVAAGAHAFRFGVDYRRLAPISGVQEYSLNVAINTAAAVLSGTASRVVVTANKGRLHPRFTNFSAYAQDTWRARQRLTITYGVRWELNPAPGEANGDDPFTVQGLDDPATMTLAPQGTPFFETTYGNFAPRVGVAYQLSDAPGRETVLRGGFGVFYDLGTGTSGTAFYGASFPNSVSKTVLNAALPLSPEVLAPRPFGLNTPYSTLYVTDPHLTLPRTYQWHFGGEQSLGMRQSLSAAYVGAAGRRLLRQELLVNPNPNFTSLFVTRNSAGSDYHALQVQFQRRLSRGLQALASYTWSHSIDNVSFESSLNPLSAAFDPGRDRGPSDFDVRHTLSAALTYNLPVLTTKELLKPILRSWSVDAILRTNTAPPVNVIAGGRPLAGLFGSTRPDLIVGVPLYIDDPTAPGGRRINRAAFAFPPPNQQGTLGRNALRGFPVSQLDVAVRRQFGLTERLKLQLRAEAFNVLNHPNFGSPVIRINSPVFGLSQSMLNNSLGFDGGLNPLYQIGGPRSIQLAARLQF